jgi:4-nitrophenyl phosphatase
MLAQSAWGGTILSTQHSALSTPGGLADLRALLVDLDGVVYRGDTVLPGALELFAYLRARRLPFVLLTNNSTLTPRQYQAKLRGLGIRVAVDELLTSAQATALYLVETADPGARVLVLGERGLRQALTEAGFTLAEEDGEYVVVGLDRTLTYRRLAAACRAVSRGAMFLGPNPDVALPTEGGFVPGAGALHAAITACTGVRPRIIGKPAPTMLEQALRRLGVAPADAAMVGDSLATDVPGGRAAGLRTVLVLTGVSTTADLATAAERPDYVYPDLPALLAALGAAHHIVTCRLGGGAI